MIGAFTQSLGGCCSIPFLAVIPKTLNMIRVASLMLSIYRTGHNQTLQAGINTEDDIFPQSPLRQREKEFKDGVTCTQQCPWEVTSLPSNSAVVFVWSSQVLSLVFVRMIFVAPPPLAFITIIIVYHA